MRAALLLALASSGGMRRRRKSSSRKQAEPGGRAQGLVGGLKEVKWRTWRTKVGEAPSGASWRRAGAGREVEGAPESKGECLGLRESGLIWSGYPTGPLTMASGPRPGSSRQLRLLPPPGLEAPQPFHDRHPRPSRLARRPGSPTGLRRVPAASGGVRPLGLLAGPARHAPFPAPLAWGRGLCLRLGFRPTALHLKRSSATPTCGLHSEVCSNPNWAPLFPPLASRLFEAHLVSLI